MDLIYMNIFPNVFQQVLLKFEKLFDTKTTTFLIDYKILKILVP